MKDIKPIHKGSLLVGCLVLFAIPATYYIHTAGLDIGVSSLFHDGNTKGNPWPIGEQFPWRQLYDYGAIPTIVLMVAALISYVLSLFGKITSQYRGPCLVVFLSCLIGPGIIVNGILKPYWGRPRPAEIKVFQGHWDYKEPWSPGTPGKGKSFTCGHCSFAFASASIVSFYPYFPIAAPALAVCGIGYGSLMSVARVAQGGHFVSDALWSAIIVFCLISLLHFNVFRVPQWADYFKFGRPPPRPFSLTTRVSLVFLAFIGPSIMWLFYHPYYEEKIEWFAFRPGADQAVVIKGQGINDIKTRYSLDARYPLLKYEISGLGFPWAKVRALKKIRTEGDTVYIETRLQQSGINGLFNGEVTLELPIK